jgi:glycerol-3-phosphate acyltransferase PlsX
MRIAVDAMGGDNAPEAPIEATLLAKPQCPADLILFGNEIQLRQTLGREKEGFPTEVVHAPQTIGMGEAGPMALRWKREASLSVAMRYLAEGTVDAVVSAGNSSAIVATAKHFVGLVAGLRRPAMAVPLPAPAGKVLLLDAGAHAAADPIHLAQSAALAHAFLKVTENLAHPRIGLLNIGQEPVKGTKVIQRAFDLLERSRLNFIGNIEPQALFKNQVDIAICDGFVGNVLLKVYEGLSETLLQFLESQLVETVPDEARRVLQKTFEQLQQAYHYANIGGAPLLGIQKTVIVAHGRSQGPAIANAIHLAHQMVEGRVYERMREELENDPVLAELKHDNALLMLENFKNKWGFGESGSR